MPEITYTKCGDYLLPNIILKESTLENVEPLTKYGLLRRSYLKNHRPILYNQLLLTEKLYPHLRDVQRTSENRLETLLSQLIHKNPPPEKSLDCMAWVAHMNMLKTIADENILTELIYE